MSQISKQALIVDNNQSFPTNNAGEITPSDLRAFNVNMIDSLVSEIPYQSFTASVTNSINLLNNFSASQQPAFNALNSFTASQLTINSGYNTTTQSLNASITSINDSLNQVVAWTGSINQIQSNGTILGTSTRFNLVGPGTFFSASITPNVLGPVATLTFTSDNAKVNTSSFNEYTQSTNDWSASAKISIAALNEYTSSDNTAISNLNQFTASQTTFNASITASVVQLQDFSSSVGKTFATTGSNTFNGLQTFSQSVIFPDGQNIRFASGSSYFNQQLIPGVGDYAFSRNGASNVKVLTLAGTTGAITTFQNNNVTFNDTVGQVTFNTPAKFFSGINNSLQITGSLIVSGSPNQIIGSTTITGNTNINGITNINGSTTISGSTHQIVGNTSITGNLSLPIGKILNVGVIDSGNNIFKGITLSQNGTNNNITQINAYASQSAELYFGTIAEDYSYDVEYGIVADETGLTFSDFDNGVAYDYVPFMTIAPNLGDNPAPVMTRGLTITGSIIVTGSAYGNVISASVASSTASIDLSKANYFTLTLGANGITNINVTNPKPGVTATLVINTNTLSTASFSSNVKQSSGSLYVPSVSGNIDILSFTAVTTSSVYVVPAYTFV